MYVYIIQNVETITIIFTQFASSKNNPIFKQNFMQKAPEFEAQGLISVILI